MQMIIGGQKTNASDGKFIEVFNPATQQLIDTIPSATKEDIDKALQIAQEGKKIWANTPQHERSRILTKFAEALQAQRKEFETLLTNETGKTIIDSEIEFDNTNTLFKGFAAKAEYLYGTTMPNSLPSWKNDIIFTRREPLGVIASILPFNYPAELYAHKVAPALAVGNVVILKPPSDNPLTVIRMTELLQECGAPGSVIQIVTGRGSSVGNWLASSPLINAISFTGSTETGIALAKLGAPNLTRVFTELGGNDACIIFEDADIDFAVNEVIAGRMPHAGQTCCATKRVLVQNAIKDEFAKRLVDKVRKLKVGDPLDRQSNVGCLISEKAAIEVEEQVKHTLEQGAKCLCGGKRFNKSFFEPTVLVDVTADMDIAKDMEIFGPILPIIGFDTLEEAVGIANQSSFGLQGGVISGDANKSMKVATMMECGAVVTNGCSAYRSPDQPFGGYKMTGHGREGFSYTLEEMTQIKTIVLKHILK